MDLEANEFVNALMQMNPDALGSNDSDTTPSELLDAQSHDTDRSWQEFFDNILEEIGTEPSESSQSSEHSEQSEQSESEDSSESSGNSDSESDSESETSAESIADDATTETSEQITEDRREIRTNSKHSILIHPNIDSMNSLESAQKLNLFRYLVCEGKYISLRKHLRLVARLAYKFHPTDVLEFYCDAIKFNRNRVLNQLVLFFHKDYPVKNKELLFLALRYGNSYAFDLLLKLCSIPLTVYLRQTLLHKAVEKSLTYVKVLYKAGIQITENDYIVLHRATQKGKLDILEYVLNEQFNYSLYPEILREMYLTACRNGKLRILQFFKRRFNHAVPYGINDSCDLFYAVYYNHAQVVRFLIKSKKCDASEQHDRCLIKACENNNPEICALLLEDPRVSGTGLNGYKNPLQICIHNNYYECAEILIQRQRYDESYIRECCLLDNAIILRCIFHHCNESEFIVYIHDSLREAVRQGATQCLTTIFVFHYFNLFMCTDAIARITITKLYKHNSLYTCQHFLRFFYRYYVLQDTSAIYENNTGVYDAHNRHFWYPKLLAASDAPTDETSFVCPICYENVNERTEDLYKHCDDRQIFHMACLYKYSLTNFEKTLLEIAETSAYEDNDGDYDWFVSHCVYKCPVCRRDLNILEFTNIYFCLEHDENELLVLHTREKALYRERQLKN